MAINWFIAFINGSVNSIRFHFIILLIVFVYLFLLLFLVRAVNILLTEKIDQNINGVKR